MEEKLKLTQSTVERFYFISSGLDLGIIYQEMQNALCYYAVP